MFIHTYTYICEIMVCFCLYLFVRAPFAQAQRRPTEEGRPETVVEVWAPSVQCALKLCFSAGVGTTISRVFLCEVFFCFLCFFKCWRVLLTRISLKTAWLAVTLGSLYMDRFGVLYHPTSLGVLRAVCRVPCVTRACAVCNAIQGTFFLKKNRPPVQIAWVQP